MALYIDEILRKGVTEFWVIGHSDGDIGPYDTEREAEETKRGIRNFERYKDVPGYITCEPAETLVQTFLPYESFTESAKCLDNKRLGNQRNEALVILKNVLGVADGWKHHPAVKMWKGYPDALALYGLIICDEWSNRGFNDTVMEQIEDLFNKPVSAKEFPAWIGLKEFHDSHKASLLRKNYKHYSQFNWGVNPDLPYVWPR